MSLVIIIFGVSVSSYKIYCARRGSCYRSIIEILTGRGVTTNELDPLPNNRGD